MGTVFVACNVIGGQVYVFAQSLGGTDNINLYTASGQMSSQGGSDALMTRISDACKTYDNFVGVNKEVKYDQQLANFDTYKEL